MLKRDCWQARSNWSAEISMALARLSWALLCSMMIRPLLLAHWTKRHPRISGLVEARKQIGCPGSCARSRSDDCGFCLRHAAHLGRPVESSGDLRFSLRRAYEMDECASLLDRAMSRWNLGCLDLPRSVRTRCRHYWHSPARH